jgi:Tfp pilus assembly protein PilX
MKNIKEKGFALILSLVLLLAMSLMGGSLILITSEDHKSNNLVDVEQQAFHVAEMALLEGEAYLADQYQGPLEWDPGTQTAVRNLADANLPNNLNTLFAGTMSPSTNGLICINSFRNLPGNLQVIDLVPATANVPEGLSFNFGAFLTASSVPMGNDQAFFK